MTRKYIRYNNVMVIISLLRILLALFTLWEYFWLITYLLSANYRNKTIITISYFAYQNQLNLNIFDCILNSIEVGKTVSEQFFFFLTKKTIIKLVRKLKVLKLLMILI